MSEKPKKQLVGWSVYLITLCQRTALRGAASFSGCAGVIFLLAAIVTLIRVIVLHQDLNLSTSEFILGMAGIGAIGLLLLFLSSLFFQDVKEIEPVAPITRHNVGDLSEFGTLVRPSDLPPSQQQAELLRAAQPGHEMPPEELLRATQGNRDSRP